MNPSEAHTNLDEPTHDPEIHQWFQGLGSPAVQQASPYLRAKVRARILNQQRRAGIGFGGRRAMSRRASSQAFPSDIYPISAR